jgi:hypothetical protein
MSRSTTSCHDEARRESVKAVPTCAFDPEYPIVLACMLKLRLNDLSIHMHGWRMVICLKDFQMQCNGLFYFDFHIYGLGKFSGYIRQRRMGL